VTSTGRLETCIVEILARVLIRKARGQCAQVLTTLATTIPPPPPEARPRKQVEPDCPQSYAVVRLGSRSHGSTLFDTSSGHRMDPCSSKSHDSLPDEEERNAVGDRSSLFQALRVIHFHRDAKPSPRKKHRCKTHTREKSVSRVTRLLRTDNVEPQVGPKTLRVGKNWPAWPAPFKGKPIPCVTAQQFFVTISYVPVENPSRGEHVTTPSRPGTEQSSASGRVLSYAAQDPIGGLNVPH